jgi:hypothetical protein
MSKSARKDAKCHAMDSMQINWVRQWTTPNEGRVCRIPALSTGWRLVMGGRARSIVWSLDWVHVQMMRLWWDLVCVHPRIFSVARSAGGGPLSQVSNWHPLF